MYAEISLSTPEKFTDNVVYILNLMEDINKQLKKGKLILRTDKGGPGSREGSIGYMSYVYYKYTHENDNDFEVQLQMGPPLYTLEKDTEPKFYDAMPTETYLKYFYNYLTVGILLDLYVEKLTSLFDLTKWNIEVHYSTHMGNLYFGLTCDRISFNIRPNLNYGIIHRNENIDMVNGERFSGYAFISCEIRGFDKEFKLKIDNFDELDECFSSLFNETKERMKQKFDKLLSLQLDI